VARAGLVCASAAVVLGACADSGYQYVKSPSEDAFFKVPDSWELYRIESEEPTDRVEPIDLGGSEPWQLVFDGSPEASLDHVAQAAPDAPVGQAVVLDLSSSQRDAVSLAALRASATTDGKDPLELAGQGDPTMEIVAYEDLVTADDMRGSHIVFNRQLEDGTWITVDHTALLNPATTRAYLFTVRCSATCFESNQSEISRIVGSWTVEKKG
jgi:hypothetical protein